MGLRLNSGPVAVLNAGRPLLALNQVGDPVVNPNREFPVPPSEGDERDPRPCFDPDYTRC